jgi:hypothetical protein
MKKSYTKHPPVQGVQISSAVSSIRLCAINSTMTLEERQTQMYRHYCLVKSMLDSYYNHFVVLTENLEKSKNV